jgi:hypothetical protein
MPQEVGAEAGAVEVDEAPGVGAGTAAATVRTTRGLIPAKKHRIVLLGVCQQAAVRLLQRVVVLGMLGLDAGGSGAAVKGAGVMAAGLLGMLLVPPSSSSSRVLVMQRRHLLLHLQQL